VVDTVPAHLNSTSWLPVLGMVCQLLLKTSRPPPQTFVVPPPPQVWGEVQLPHEAERVTPQLSVPV
jgi:hypothetical protein